jgi:hypothetical protein
MLKRRDALLGAALVLAGCAVSDEPSGPPAPFGDFRLGYAITVADKAKQAGPSRQATPEEWEAEINRAVRARLDRYQGEKLYHIGVGVRAYALAIPGIPIVLSPKSALVAAVDVWDDSARRTINAEPKEFTVFEDFSGSTVIGSGLTRSREEQMQTLAANLADRINAWLVENEAWFSSEAVAARAALAAAQPATGQPAPPAAATPAN